LAPAPAGIVPPAALPGPIPFAAAAAALPADAAEFALPTEWQDIYPLPPDSADNSISDEFYDATSANNTQDGATALGEDDIRLIWRRIPTITPNREPPHRFGDLPLRQQLPAAELCSAPSCTTSRRRRSPTLETRKPSCPASPEVSAPLEEELEEASLKLLKLTRKVLALTNRHSSTMRFSRKLTDTRKRRNALYKLCKQLHCSNSSDSGRSSDTGPGSSGTNSIGLSGIYDPRRWRPSDTADSSPISSPQPEGRYTPTPLHLLPPPAHPPSDLLGLASQFRDTLSFRCSDPEPLDLSHR
jgi:hypothetical protein